MNSIGDIYKKKYYKYIFNHIYLIISIPQLKIYNIYYIKYSQQHFNRLILFFRIYTLRVHSRVNKMSQKDVNVEWNRIFFSFICEF